MITIRNLTIEDMVEAAKLQVLCWSEELAEKAQNTYVAKDVKDSWIKWMSSSEENNDVRLLIGAFEDNKMLGVAYSSFAETEDIPEKGIELNGLWVYPECRGKRISLKLIVHMLNYYKNIGKEKLVIYNHHFAPSNEFYKKFGATVLRQDKQMGGKLLVDVFISDIDVFKSNVEKSLLKYENIMKIDFKEFTDEIDMLIEFSTSDTWEFYGTPNPKPERIRASYENNYYNGDDCKTFWIVLDEDIKAGTLRIYDLEDDTPMFDIRILSKYKGMGIGTKAVNWLVKYIFSNYSDTNRIEANTRQDNYAMRCVFSKCNFAKEAHYRKAWVGNNGIAYDAIGYGITREDWENGQITPLNWNDFKC